MSHEAQALHHGKRSYVPSYPEVPSIFQCLPQKKEQWENAGELSIKWSGVYFINILPLLDQYFISLKG